MPEFFPFIPGTETGRAARQHASDASPLLGRFRAVPPSRAAASSLNPRASQQQQLGLLSSGGRGSVHVGYGALLVAGLEGDYEDEEEDEDEDEDDDGDGDDGNNNNTRGCGGILRRTGRAWRRLVRLSRRNVRDLWIAPRQSAVKRVVENWWSRWGVLVFLPAALVSGDSRFFSFVPSTIAACLQRTKFQDTTPDTSRSWRGLSSWANDIRTV